MGLKAIEWLAVLATHTCDSLGSQPKSGGPLDLAPWREIKHNFFTNHPEPPSLPSLAAALESGQGFRGEGRGPAPPPGHSLKPQIFSNVFCLASLGTKQEGWS